MTTLILNPTGKGAWALKRGLLLATVRQYSVAAVAALALLGLAGPAGAATFTLCPSAASSQAGAGSFTFANVPGPLDATCGPNSAVQMDIATQSDYARLAWLSGDAGYPAGLTFGSLAGLSADVSFTGQPGDQPFYMLAFTDATLGLGQGAAANQILMIQFQPSTVSGNTMAVDPNATLFNLYDNDAGVYLAGGQQDTDTVAGWLALYPFLAVEALDQLRIGVGLAPGGNSANTLVINSLDITTAAVPEPISLALLGIGLAGLGFSRRRKTA